MTATQGTAMLGLLRVKVDALARGIMATHITFEFSGARLFARPLERIVGRFA